MLYFKNIYIYISRLCGFFRQIISILQLSLILLSFTIKKDYKVYISLFEKKKKKKEKYYK